MWGSGRSFLGRTRTRTGTGTCASANSSKVTRWREKKTTTHIYPKSSRVFHLLRRQRQHMSTFVGWPGVFTLEKTSYSVWRLITEREPNFFLHITFLFIYSFLNSDIGAVQHWRLKWRLHLGITQTEPKTATAWIAAPSSAEHARGLASALANHIW